MSEPKSLFETLFKASTSELDNDMLEKKIWDHYGQTRSVLVLDSTGFSRTTQKKGIVHFLTIVAKMRMIGGCILAEHNATGLRAEADNLYAEFVTPDAAVDAAFELHQYFKENKIYLYDEEPFLVSIGIGYGPLLKSKYEGMFGDEMNLASKLGENRAEGGETLITEAAFEALKNREHMTSHRKSLKISGVEVHYFQVEPKKALEV